MGRLKTVGPRVATLKTATASTRPTERKRGRQGQRDREMVLQRDGYVCLHCQGKGRVTRATQVDHIVPLAVGGSDTDSNKQSLCDDCHGAKTADDRSRYGLV